MTGSRDRYDIPPAPAAIRGVGLVIVLFIWEAVCIFALVLGPDTRPFSTFEFVWWISAAVLLPAGCFAVVQFKDLRLRRFKKGALHGRGGHTWAFRSGSIASRPSDLTVTSTRKLGAGVLLADQRGGIDILSLDTGSVVRRLEASELVSVKSATDRFGSPCLRVTTTDSTVIDLTLVYADAKDLFGAARRNIGNAERTIAARG